MNSCFSQGRSPPRSRPEATEQAVQGFRLAHWAGHVQWGCAWLRGWARNWQSASDRLAGVPQKNIRHCTCLCWNWQQATGTCCHFNPPCRAQRCVAALRADNERQAAWQAACQRWRAACHVKATAISKAAAVTTATSTCGAGTLQRLPCPPPAEAARRGRALEGPQEGTEPGSC